MSTSPITVYLRGCVAVPVGHRVEVAVFRYEQFGGPMFDRPVINDLDTGVTYGELPLFLTTNDRGLLKPPTTTLPSLREHARWRGTVLLCQVLADEDRASQSTLIIAPESSSEPYR
jgi:hypothetical protein